MGGTGGPWALDPYACCGATTSSYPAIYLVVQFGPDLTFSGLDVTGFVGADTFSIGTNAYALGYTANLDQSVSLEGRVDYLASATVRYFYESSKPNDVPEPVSLALVSTALLGVAVTRRRKRQSATC